ncbi:hypothetical protein QNI16_35865 [Cytophagaceae bacterium YF14B1]|uniref:Uncharacterized protein n=1 Tax=Xanthocytophaga flava TaxID=3048013 RepID=A0AAE3UDL9_9BACT|nr:hypothetical protein [Xanthocytophaga flavus]MDJ1485914.1 hypothetical protein [Xanthocytophaga flavus]
MEKQIVATLLALGSQLLVFSSIYQLLFKVLSVEMIVGNILVACVLQLWIIIYVQLNILGYDEKLLHVVSVLKTKTYPFNDFLYVKPCAGIFNVYKIGFSDGKEYLCIPSKGKTMLFEFDKPGTAKAMEAETNSLKM